MSQSEKISPQEARQRYLDAAEDVDLSGLSVKYQVQMRDSLAGMARSAGSLLVLDGQAEAALEMYQAAEREMQEAVDILRYHIDQ